MERAQRRARGRRGAGCRQPFHCRLHHEAPPSPPQDTPIRREPGEPPQVTMALWTPYAEQALDLTKNVKQERVSPFPSAEDGSNSAYQYSAPNLPVEHYPSFAPMQSPDSSRSTWSPYSNSKSSPSPARTPELYDMESLSEDVEYQAFERDALRAMAEKNGGSLLGNNPRMRRAVQGGGHSSDDSYRQQRARNNHAAKQSRDRRKLREVRLAFQVTFLQKKLTALRERLGSKFCSRCQHT